MSAYQIPAGYGRLDWEGGYARWIEYHDPAIPGGHNLTTITGVRLEGDHLRISTRLGREYLLPANDPLLDFRDRLCPPWDHIPHCGTIWASDLARDLERTGQIEETYAREAA